MLLSAPDILHTGTERPSNIRCDLPWISFSCSVLKRTRLGISVAGACLRIHQSDSHGLSGLSFIRTRTGIIFDLLQRDHSLMDSPFLSYDDVPHGPDHTPMMMITQLEAPGHKKLYTLHQVLSPLCPRQRWHPVSPPSSCAYFSSVAVHYS